LSEELAARAQVVNVRHIRWSFIAVRVLTIGLYALGLTAGLAFSVSTVDAQLVNGRFQLPPQSAGSSRGVARAPEPTVIVVSPSTLHRSVFPRRPLYFTMIPAVVMSDGSVLADFGFGFEPVVRSCAGTVFLSGEPKVIAGNGVVLSQGATYTQPVPNQLTPSQISVSSGQSQTVVLSSAAQTACFTRDGTGRVVVVR
jgi:hypothetical protein